MKITRLITTLFTLMLMFQARATIHNVTVLANHSIVDPTNPLFTDTDISLTVNQVIHINATGAWTHNYFNDPTLYGPDGTSGTFPISGGFPIGELIGYVGTTPQTANPVFFEVGSSLTYTATASGHLWLGMNDAYDPATGELNPSYFIDDNVGQMNVAIGTGGDIPTTPCSSVVFFTSPTTSTAVECGSIVLEADSYNVSAVNFYSNATFLGAGELESGSSTRYRYVWNNPPRGTYALSVEGVGCSSQIVTAPGPTITTKGAVDAVAWWPGDNARDVMGGNNGTTPGPWGLFGSGKVNNGFQLDGDHYCAVPASSSLDVGTLGGFTIEAWVQPTSDPTVEAPMIEWDSPQAEGLHLSVQPGLKLYANIKDTSGNDHVIQETTGSLSTTVYKHVALTYDKTSGVASLYVDGSLVKTENFGSITPQTTFPVNIGARTSGLSANRFNGGIDELTLYGRALSSSDVLAIYRFGSAGKCRPKSVPTPADQVEYFNGEPSGGIPTLGFSWNAVYPHVSKVGMSQADSKVYNGFTFDGNRTYMVVNESQSLDVGQYNSGFTIEAWIKPGSVTSMQPIAEYERELGTSSASDLGVQFWTIGRGVWANIVDTGGHNHIFYTTASLLTQDTWSHVALTYNSSSYDATLYVDGTQVAQTNMSSSFTPQTSFKLIFGARTTFGSAAAPQEDFLGEMDEMSLYKRELTATEISDIYTADSNGKGGLSLSGDSSLVSWWTGSWFNSERGQGEWSPKDSVGLNHGTIENALWYEWGMLSDSYNFAGYGGYMWFDPADYSSTSTLDLGQSTSGFTIETWINPDQVTTENPIAEYEQTLGTSSSSDLGVQFWTYLNGGIYANIVDTSGNNHEVYTSSPLIKARQWSHVALVYDKASGYVDLYVNGAVAKHQSITSVTPQTSYKLVLGARTTFGSAASPEETFPGKMDQISLYNRPLTENEILSIYAARTAGKF